MDKQRLSSTRLAKLAKPARYVGGEVNMVHKEGADIAVRMVLAFPDVYEIGMSHTGSKILYELVNALPWAAMERTYAPWGDMEQALREENIPLTALESGRALHEFDIVGFSLQTELGYTNLVNMLDLGGIPIWQAERTNDDPLVIAGGPGAFAPEPLADFLDVVVIGDAEDALPKLLEAYSAERKKEGYCRASFMDMIAQWEGIYVPSLYNQHYDDGHMLVSTLPKDTAPLPVRRAVVADLDRAFVSCQPLLPYIETVHDRAVLELFRGCTNGCRFCQAGIIYRPVRERSVANLREQAVEQLRASGYEEISLTSLSSMDYTCLEELVDALHQDHAAQGVGLALSSLRVDSFSIELAKKVQKVRKSGLTLAPEAGSQRLRDVINKNVTQEQIVAAITDAFRAGWSSIKLYFMIGLPGETDSDLDGIVALAERIVALHRELRVRGKLRLAISVSPFVPKPHTPFQWGGQIPLAEIERRQGYLLQKLRPLRGVEFSSHDRRSSLLEAFLSRGERKLSGVILEAWKRGARFDGWSECFNMALWREASEACGLDMSAYAERAYAAEDCLPWDHLDSGITKAWLLSELRKSESVETTEDCRYGQCSGCGICPSYGISNRFAGEVRR